MSIIERITSAGQYGWVRARFRNIKTKLLRVKNGRWDLDMNLSIETENLGKNYRNVKAVEPLITAGGRGRDLRFSRLERRRKNYDHPNAAWDDQAYQRICQGVSDQGTYGRP